jgi:amidase
MDSANLAYASLLDVSESIRRKEISPVAVTQVMLDRIATLDSQYRSYVTVLGERALQQATKAEDEINKGMWRGPLQGVPIAVKDLVHTTFATTTAGTAVHRDFIAPANATVIDRFEQAGAVLLGKLKMTEGAYTNHHPDVQPPLNPWNPDYWVGTSSTGPGAAVSAGLCYGALGSDTGGSIRFPSATCGLTGIKPTWGRVSRHGVFALASSLDHVGTMCRTAGDAVAMLGAMAGEDQRDPTTLLAPLPDYLGSLAHGVRGMRIGVDRSYTREAVDAQVLAALDEAERIFAALGANIHEVQTPPSRNLTASWMTICAVEVAVAHLETYPKNKAQYGPELAAFLEFGRSVDGVEMGRIAHDRLNFAGGLARCFEQIDLLLVPTMPTPTPRLSDLSSFGTDSNVLIDMLRFTAPFDFSGSPTITLPNGVDRNGLPLSMQLVGPHLSEDVLARAGHAFQSVTDWHARRPASDRAAPARDP